MTRHRFLLWLMMLIAGTVSLSAQGYTLKGTVEDIMNEPLIGASVMVKGTSQGTMTDFDGNFSIQVMNGDVLTFSYVGYLAKEITVAGQNDITVVLEEAAQNLNELVVVGYGTARKKDLTGSVAQINPS